MEQLFIYGTLMDPVVQQRLLGHVCPYVADAVTGYALTTLQQEGSTYLVLVPDDDFGIPIPGLVIETSLEELFILDDYEGQEYERVRVILTSGREAWAYVFNDSLQGDAP